MEIHGIRPELQPEAINKKAREAAEANAQADKPVKVESSNRLLDVKG